MERLGYVDHPDVSQLRVDDVLLLRICWTRFLSDGYKFPFLSNGPWAGHCFDIVPLEQGGVSAVGNGWKDSTDEIVKQVMEAGLKIVPPVPPVPSEPSPSRRKRKRRGW